MACKVCLQFGWDRGLCKLSCHWGHDLQECWESCQDWPGCQSWYWCDQREGCMDAEGRQYPFKGCELRAREVIRRLGLVPPDWRLPTFATGFMRRAHP